MINIVTLDSLVAPVTNQELIDWGKFDSDDPRIAPSLIMGTSLVISFLSLDSHTLIIRVSICYTLTY